MRGKRKTKIEFVMMRTLHNIKKIADFMKREGKSLKEILNLITGGRNEYWSEGRITAAKASSYVDQ